MTPLDTYQYMLAAYHKTYDYPPAVAYDTKPDDAAIKNLHKLQKARPLKPPRKNELETDC